MSSTESGTQRTGSLPAPRLGSNDKQPDLPLDIILYIAQFTKFADYRNFIRALWPDKEGSYDPGVLNKLWQLSTRRFTMPFINGKPVEIEYNYDPERTNEPVLINPESLRPVLGGLVPPNNENFLSVWNIQQFVLVYIQLNKCPSSQHPSCPCGHDIGNQTARAFVKPQTSTCGQQHFHHYCSEHINYWLDKLLASILNIEKGTVVSKDAIDDFILFLDTKVYFRSSEMRIVDSWYSGPARSSRE